MSNSTMGRLPDEHTRNVKRGTPGQKGGRWLAKDKDRVGTIKNTIKLWAPVPIKPKLAKPKPKTAPIPKESACFNGCGLIFPSRRAAGLHSHTCLAGVAEGAD